MAGKKNWNVLNLLKTTTDYFLEKGIENPRLNAEMLLGSVLKLRRVDLYVAFERPLTESELSAFREMVRRRAGHEPLQYILQETEFMGLPFKTTPAVLIPRPETEILVEEVLKLHSEYAQQEVSIIDFGTGSGCIPVSLAHYWKSSRIFASDISAEALAVAEENKTINGIQNTLTFVRHNIFEDWPDELPASCNIVVSNPPYIREDEMAGLSKEVAQFEPRIALTDDSNGLRFYRRIFELAQNGKTISCDYLFLEMSGSQPQEIIDLAGNYSFAAVTVINDLNDIPRVLKIKVKYE